MDYALTLPGDAIPLSGVVYTFSPTAQWAGWVYSRAESLAVRFADGEPVSTADVEARLEDALFDLGCPAHVQPPALERALFGRVLGLGFVWEGRS